MRNHISTAATPKHLLVCLLLSAACPVALPQGPRASSPELEDPLLTLEDAVSMALANNRLIAISVLETQKADDLVGVACSQRLPHFEFDVLGGSLLQPFDFTFPAGSFGDYPGIGPVPSTDAKIRTEEQFVTTIHAAIDQPLTQQHKIHLGIRAREVGRDIASEDLRAERQRVASAVRKAYFDLVATHAALEAAREAVAALTEVQRVTGDHRAREAVLHADALEVDARLAKSRYELATTENRLATQREILNDLLGRDLATRFRVVPIPEEDESDLTLDAARSRAVANRPEIRQAQLKEQQAEYMRRIAKADYVPDVNLSVRYTGFDNYEVLPTSVITAGVFLRWEPFDWGRRKRTVAEKSKTVEQARSGAQQTQSQIAIEAGTAYRAWHETALLVEAARTGYEAAREQLRVTGERYKVEAALLKDLLEAQARSTEAAFQYQQSLSSYWGAMAGLHRAMGEE